MTRTEERGDSEADAAAAIAEDWKTDSAGEPRLSKTRFCDSLFEVADMWTSAIGIRCQAIDSGP